MSCLRPVVVPRAKDNPCPLTGSKVMQVPCGKCPECYKRRAKSWSFRLSEELKVSSSACFLTLTYDDENLPCSFNGYMTLDKRDFQLFMKRLRKKSVNKLRYYAVGEYGSKFKRPHYHVILFNLPHAFIEKKSEVTEIWRQGIVDFGDVNMASIHYVTGYVNKGGFKPFGELDDRVPEFSLMSKGLGKSHLSDSMIYFYNNNGMTFSVMPGGYKIPMPRYYRELMFKAKVGFRAEYEGFKERKFKDAKHELEWNIDQFRKHDKRLKLERQTF